MVIHNTILTDWTIDLFGISKNYKHKIALNNVTIKWEKGVLGLIGPNGAGKTTLIKILTTILKPDTGYAKILGKDVVNQSFEVRRRIGVLFENPGFHPKLKVLPSLCWVGELRGLSPEIAKHQVLELLEYFELENTFNHEIKELSAGMRQKYGLIFATLGTPPLIILDEPTSNLDPDARRLYKMYVNRLVKENKCNFLISSHVLGELDSLCNGFAFLFEGGVVESGKREELKLKTPFQRFKLITSNLQSLIPIISNEGIKIESEEQTEIIVRVKTYNELMKLDSHIKQLGFSEGFQIIPLESGVEALYRQLSNQHRKRILEGGEKTSTHS